MNTPRFGLVPPTLWSDPRARAAAQAMGLWAFALSWCVRELTFGFVPESIPAELVDDGAKMAEQLVEVGLWSRVQGGFSFAPSGVRFQPTQEQLS